MKRLKNFVLMFLVGSFLLFWLLYFATGLDATTEISAGLALGAMLTLSITWLPASMRALAKVTGGVGLDGYQMFHLGLWGLSVDLLLQRIWSTALRWADRPEWMLELPVGAFTAWGIACFGAMIIMSPGTIEGEVLNRNKLYVVFAACFGSTIAGITIGFFIAKW